ncbi:MAG TPA: hypothetical protein VGT04_07035 [Acidobacteriaceae bacterium]|nr:hypothetical protein [Acidobacteriaceae bacterium]
MSRNLDASLLAALPEGVVQPAILAALTFKSGTAYAWSGVGPLTYGGNTYQGVGALGEISPVSEGTEVNAEGMAIKLSGLQLVPFVGSGAPGGLTAPVTPPTGQFVAWVKATEAVAWTDGPSTRQASATLTGGVVGISGSAFGESVGAKVTWSDFIANLPPDAVIQNIYLVANVTGTGDGVTFMGFGGLPIPVGNFSGQYYVNVGNTLAELEAYEVAAEMGQSLPGATNSETWVINGIALAVYYTSASNSYSLVNEALGDIQLGAPASIYFGLVQNGALIGNPYMIFSGLIDQPTVDVGVDTISISIALENKLSNLARPTARRYTANDQHIDYPDDIAFNWVETLNDIALRWGS